MAPVALVLIVSLFAARAVMAVPVLPHALPTTVDSVPASTSASTSTDVPPTLVFTLGPSTLPPVSTSAATSTGTASTTSRRMEMDWLS